MLTKIIDYFYPGLNNEERNKFLRLGGILFLILGSYWLAKIMKDTVVFTLAGWDPEKSIDAFVSIKIVMPIVMLLIVIAYSPYISRMSKQKLLYNIWRMYAGIFLMFAALFFVHNIDPHFISSSLMKFLAYLLYFAAESFGAVTIPLFWAFNNSITLTQSAKKGFPLILALGHTGGFLFSTLPILQSTLGNINLENNVPVWFFLITISCTIYIASKIFNNSMFRAIAEKKLVAHKQKVNETFAQRTKSMLKELFAGGIFLAKNNYLLGVFILSTFYEIIILVIETDMLYNARVYYEDYFIIFKSSYSLCIQVATIFFATIVPRFLKKFGIRVALLILPLFSLIALFICVYNISLSSTIKTSLFLLTGIYIFLKGLIYAFNFTCKEIMWIPTSREIKFKAKGWVDTFGNRFMKSGTGTIRKLTTQHPYVLYTFCLAAILVWIGTSINVGRQNKKLLDKNEILE